MAGGFSSQAGHILVRTQTGLGVFPADFVTKAVGVRLRSGSLGSDRTLMIPDAEIGGNRDVADAYLGPIKWSGEYQFYVRLNSFLTFLQAGAGPEQTPGAAVGGVTTHTITPSDAADLLFLGIEEQVGAVGLEVFQYTDAVVNTLHLESAADGYFMGAAGMIAMKQVAGIVPTPADALTDKLPMTVGTNITVTFNGVTLPAKSFTWDMNNQFEDTDFRLGSLYLGSLVPKRREVTGSVTIRPSDASLWHQAVYGSAAANVPGGVATKGAFVITASTYESIAASAPPTPQSIAITHQQAILEPFNFAPSGDAIIEPSVNIRAVRPNPAQPLFTAVAKTDIAAIA